MDFFFLLNKLSEIKNRNRVNNFKIEFDDFRINGKKKNFGELSDESFNRIWSLYWYCIGNVYILYKAFFFLSWCEKIVKVFDMTRPGIEPRSPRPLANTLANEPVFQSDINNIYTII